MKRPFLCYTLLEFLVNGKKIQYADSVAKELLTTLQAQDLVLITYIDRDLVESVVTTEDWYDRLMASDPDNDEQPASEELVNYTQQIVNRIKSENADMVEKALQPSKMSSEVVKKDYAPEDLKEDGNISELEEMYEVDMQKREEEKESKPVDLSIEISDDE